MFSWKKVDDSINPRLRFLHVLQLIAVLSFFVGICLAWWRSDHTSSALNLMGRSIKVFIKRDYLSVGEPLLVLWLLWPLMVVGLLRAITGIMVAPVSYRRLALATWGAALLALGHFYINFHHGAPADSMLHGGTMQRGFWLAAVSASILGVLILAENVFTRPPLDRFAKQEVISSGAVEEAERLWRGDYQSCPYCGMLNEPGAKTCYNCRNLLFNFLDSPDQKVTK
jgi:hypothetical protein